MKIINGAIPTRIKFEYYDSFTNESLGGADMIYDRIKATRNFYSKWWKKWRSFLANEYGVQKHFVRVKITFKYY